MDSGRKRNRAAARPGVYHMFHSALRVGLGTPAFHSSLGDVLAMSSLPQAAFGGFDTHRFVDAISTASRAVLGGVAHDLAQSIENQLITTAANEDVETWWTALPLQVRVAVVVTVVWVCVFLTATTWSMEDPAISKYLQDHTQIGPLTLATAASWAARVVYRRTSGSE